MRTRGLAAAAVLVAFSTIAAVKFGGWAVVSVTDAPDYLVVGKPATFDFVVRQHGIEPMHGLKPNIVAKKGIRWVNGTVTASPTAGLYRATIAVPSTGDWSITIESGFGPSKGRLLPKRAIDANEQPPSIASAERGRQLFASAGCVTCHVHGGVEFKPLWDFKAPELTDKRFAADYLAKFLTDPSIKPKAPDIMQMPNPQLRQTDIASLVAFINTERKVANR